MQIIKTNRPSDFQFEKRIFIEISGDFKDPGVYEVVSSENLEELITTKWDGRINRKDSLLISRSNLKSGRKLVLSKKGDGISISKEEMSSFYKTTLGIPLSLNHETAIGLTAIPGIGHKTALAIVKARHERGVFRKIDDILTVPGVGLKLFKEIKPFLKL